MKKIGILFLVVTFTVVACAPPPAGMRSDPIDDAVAGPNPMVHQDGLQIVDPAGNPLKLRGVFLEGWLQWNGPLWGAGLTSETEIADRLIQLAGEAEFEAFRTGLYDAFITEADIAMIADMDFNVVRIPINHTVLENEAGAVDEAAVGWAYLDRLLAWCEAYDVYVVLELHAAPGGQSPWFVSDPELVKLWESEENKTRTIAIWQALAARYQDREIIAGYDLLNEPDFPYGTVLVDLYIRIIEAIRTVDPYHMIILEGNKLATDFSIFSQPLSSNQAYSFHSYNLFTNDVDQEVLQQLALLAEAQQVPLWNSEFGAHNATWLTQMVALFEAPDSHISGWVFWPWKRVPEIGDRYRVLMGISSPAAWDPVRVALSLPINPENTISAETAVQGMNAFLAAVAADQLVLDPEIAAILAVPVAGE